MKIALINDTHFGARNDANVFLDVQERFFNKCFFPYLKEHDIDTILHLGDLFDRRKYINFKTLERAEEMFFRPMRDNNITMDIIPGNHDVYYKDTNVINSINLLARKYDNINVYDEKPVVVNYDGTDVALIPWICRENYEQSLEFINTVKADIVAGHFEIIGFEFLPGVKNHEGLTQSSFERFSQVWSGHFHHRSTKGNICYLGTQFELTWSDAGHTKGFHIYDTATDELLFVPNPDSVFTKIYYDDTQNDYENYDVSGLEGHYVKIVVVNKENHFMFDRFIDAIQHKDPTDLSIIEDSQILDDEDYDVNHTMDTMTILENYVDQMDIKADSERIKRLMRTLHSEALSVE